jgi:hypothetical protein
MINSKTQYTINTPPLIQRNSLLLLFARFFVFPTTLSPRLRQSRWALHAVYRLAPLHRAPPAFQNARVAVARGAPGCLVHGAVAPAACQLELALVDEHVVLAAQTHASGRVVCLVRQQTRLAKIVDAVCGTNHVAHHGLAVRRPQNTTLHFLVK